MTDEVAAALGETATLMARAERPWWIIGSAAAALHGARTPVADIDLLGDEADVCAVLEQAEQPAAPGGGSALFRSSIFGSLTHAGMSIELMGGLHLRCGDGWERVCIKTREPVRVGSAILWVPAREELIALLRRFGREKDLARAALLEALSAA